jgi:hypothetical protein
MSVSMSTKEISSVSVELVLHFILFKELETAPLSKVARLLVCPLQSSWIWCDLSTYQCTAYFVWSAQSVSLRFLVPFKYFKILFSFSQSSSSGDCTLVVRKDTAVWISRCAQFLLQRAVDIQCDGRCLPSHDVGRLQLYHTMVRLYRTIVLFGMPD